MRIFHRTAETLVLREAPDTLRLLGALLAAGVLGVAAGGALLLVVRTTWCLVDPQGGTLRVRYRNVLASAEWACYLSSIADVVLEPRVSADGRTMYRVALVSASGRRIPITSYSSAPLRAQLPAVAALREFLPQNARRWTRARVTAPTLDRRQWRMVTRFLYWTAAALVLLSGVGGWIIRGAARESGLARHALPLLPLVGLLFVARAVRAWLRCAPPREPRAADDPAAETGLVFLKK